MDGVSFLAWVIQQMLAPALRPGDIVVMDNLAAHKVAGVRQAIEASPAAYFSELPGRRSQAISSFPAICCYLETSLLTY
jgi:hypothetical protein